MTTRRSFLKGAVIAASTPAAAFAPAIVAGTIGALLAEHETLYALYRQADDIEGELAKSPNRPAWAHIKAREFWPYYSGSPDPDKVYLSEVKIHELFDAERRQIGFGHYRGDEANRRYALVEEKRQRALELFRLRDEAYQAWRRESGYEAAAKEAERLSDLTLSVENRILACRCENLEEVRLKALFFDRQYGDAPSEGVVKAFIQSLAA